MVLMLIVILILMLNLQAHIQHGQGTFNLTIQSHFFDLNPPYIGNYSLFAGITRIKGIAFEPVFYLNTEKISARQIQLHTISMTDNGEIGYFWMTAEVGEINSYICSCISGILANGALCDYRTYSSQGSRFMVLFNGWKFTQKESKFSILQPPTYEGTLNTACGLNVSSNLKGYDFKQTVIQVKTEAISEIIQGPLVVSFIYKNLSIKCFSGANNHFFDKTKLFYASSIGLQSIKQAPKIQNTSNSLSASFSQIINSSKPSQSPINESIGSYPQTTIQSPIQNSKTTQSPGEGLENSIKSNLINQSHNQLEIPDNETNSLTNQSSPINSSVNFVEDSTIQANLDSLVKSNYSSSLQNLTNKQTQSNINSTFQASTESSMLVILSISNAKTIQQANNSSQPQQKMSELWRKYIELKILNETLQMKSATSKAINKMNAIGEAINEDARTTIQSVGILSLIINSPQFYSQLLFMDTYVSPMTYGTLKGCSFWVVQNIPLDQTYLQQNKSEVIIFYLVNATDKMPKNKESTVFFRLNLTSALLAIAWLPITLIVTLSLIMILLKRIQPSQDQTINADNLQQFIDVHHLVEQQNIWVSKLHLVRYQVIKSGLAVLCLGSFLCLRFLTWDNLGHLLYGVSLLIALTLIGLSLILFPINLSRLNKHLHKCKIMKKIMDANPNQVEMPALLDDYKNYLKNRYCFLLSGNDIMNRSQVYSQLFTISSKVMVSLVLVSMEGFVFVQLITLIVIQTLNLGIFLFVQRSKQKIYFVFHTLMLVCMIATLGLLINERQNYQNLIYAADNKAKLETHQRKFVNDGYATMSFILVGVFIDLIRRVVEIVLNGFKYIQRRRAKKLLLSQVTVTNMKRDLLHHQPSEGPIYINQ